MSSALTRTSPPTLVVHPTRHCPYVCVHCYSSSTPSVKGWLAPAPVVELVSAAAGAGYTRLVISGGEPLAWVGLDATLAMARLHGMERILETSGLGMTEARATALSPLVDRIRVGIDGRATRHDVMHGRGGAFANARAGIGMARAANIVVEVAHTVRVSSLHELDWIADWCVEVGAAHLLLRPLEVTGRAAQSWIAEDALGPAALANAQARVDLVSDRLRAAGLSMVFSLDDAESVRTVARRLRAPTPRDQLSQLLPQLVLEEDGTLAPLRYGFPREFSLGNIHEGPLGSLVTGWRSGPAMALAAMLDRSVSTPQVSARRWFDLGAAVRALAA